MSKIFEGVCQKDFEEPSCFRQQGATFLDPCDCGFYYECINYELLRRECTQGTLWNHNTSTCDHEPEVLYNFKFPCEYGKNTWERCDVSDERLEELRFFCTNTSVTTTPADMATTERQNTSNGISAGLVIGLIVVGATIATLLITLLLLYRRRRTRTKLQKGRPSVQNPEYFEAGNGDDPYAVIEDSMHDPAYNASKGRGTLAPPNSTLPPLPTVGYTENVEYDNSAFRSDDILGNGGYTSTLSNTPAHEYATPRTVDTGTSSGPNNETATHIGQTYNEDDTSYHTLSADINGNNDDLKRNSGTGSSADS